MNTDEEALDSSFCSSDDESGDSDGASWSEEVTTQNDVVYHSLLLSLFQDVRTSLPKFTLTNLLS
jgi:hypothetical protein